MKMKEHQGFLIVKRWPGGKIENLGCYDNEEMARFEASKIIGSQYTINLETVTIYIRDNT